MSKIIKIVNCAGEAKGDFKVSDAAIELEKGQQAVHDVVVAYRAGLRAGTACTKTRAEVRGGNSKPYRQKGTGRARAGRASSPIWRGGGIIFGPKPRSYAKHVNKKVRKLALKRAFSERVEESAVTILDELVLKDHKTKSFVEILNNLSIDGKILIVVQDYDENTLRATGNIEKLLLIKAASLNVYQLLHYKHVIFTSGAIEEFVTKISK
jgi:large subunit ribosomal protein L4